MKSILLVLLSYSVAQSAISLNRAVRNMDEVHISPVIYKNAHITDGAENLCKLLGYSLYLGSRKKKIPMRQIRDGKSVKSNKFVRSRTYVASRAAGATELSVLTWVKCAR